MADCDREALISLERDIRKLRPLGKMYEGIADISWPGFDWIVSNLIQLAAIPFTVALIVWEIAVAGLVLSKGTLVRIGLLAALIQLIGIARSCPGMSSRTCRWPCGYGCSSSATTTEASST